MDIHVRNRTLDIPALTSVGVKGDVAVEQMRFVIDRYTSAGVDLSKGIGYVVYELPDGTSDREVCPVEVMADDENKIIMTLLLYGVMMQQDGLVRFCLKISDLEGALWQSNTATVCVGDTIGEDVSAFSTFSLRRAYTDTHTYTDTSPITVTERTLHIPVPRRTIAVASDENSNRVTIQVPRYFSGYDLGQYEFMLHTEIAKSGVDDIVFNGTNGNEKTVNSNTVDLTWVLRPPQTSYAGTLRIQLYVTGEDFAWHSLIASLTVAPHLTGNPVIPVTPTVYQQYLTEVQEAVSTGRTVLADTQTAATEAAQSANAAQQAVTEVEAIVAGNTAYTKRETDVQTAPPIVPVATGESIVVNDSADRPLVGLKLFGKSTQNGTPTPDAPVEIVSVGSPTVSVYGKNLLPSMYVSGATRTHGGLTYTVQNDGGIRVSGTVTSAESYFLLSDFNFGENSVSMGGTNGTYCWSDCLYNMRNHYTMIYFSQGDMVDRTYYPQVELGTTPTDYEPPCGMKLPVSHTLPGIPVTTGGNYTDENGQQWVCDEVDFGRGVYVQRVAHYVFDGSDDEKWEFADGYNGAYFIQAAKGSEQYGTPMLCNYSTRKSWGASSQDYHYCFVNGYDDVVIGGTEVMTLWPDVASFKAHLADTPCEILYVLATPIETALTADEITAFQAIRSHKPTTTVLNDAGAGMQLEYVADTKTYIDNANVRSGRIGEVTLLASAWVGETYPYSQVVNIPGVTVNSQVDLTPSVEQLAIFHQKSLGFVTENEDGVVTVYAIGDKPQNDYTMQVTITEVRR